MCSLTSKHIKNYVHGYKVVAKYKNKYYSPAMGTQYRNDKPIEIPEVQRRLIDSYVETILHKGSYAYQEDMVGRTAIFCDKADAKKEARYQRTNLIDHDYEIKVLSARVYNDVMIGNYGSKSIAAGCKIHFYKEIG